MKKIVLSLFAILFSISAFAQQANFKGFELSGTASAGMFGLNYKTTNGTQLNGPGLRVGIGGGFFPTPNWGITTGINFSAYTAFSSIKAGTGYAYKTYDSDGLPYTHKINIDSKISEQDIMYRIELPLMINYRHYLPSGNAWYVAGGIKLSLPMAGYFHVSKGTATSSGYYPEYNATLSDLPWLGFKTTNMSGTSGMISSKSSYMGAFEIGFLRKLRKTTYATFSIYGDYGINNLRRNLNGANLIYPSSQYVGIPCSNTIDNLRLMSFGVKAAWHVNISGEPIVKGKKKTYEQPLKTVETPSNNRAKGRHQK